MVLPRGAADRVILVADVKQAINTKELRATMAAAGSKKKPRRAAVSEVGDRIVAAAERLFGKYGYRHLMASTSRRAWKAKVKTAFARAAQAEYEEALKGSDIGIGYLAIKPKGVLGAQHTEWAGERGA
jgi:hypothetical protein